MNSKEYHKEKMSGDFTMKMLAAFHSGRPVRRRLPLEKRPVRRRLGDIVIYKIKIYCLSNSPKRKNPQRGSPIYGKLLWGFYVYPPMGDTPHFFLENFGTLMRNLVQLFNSQGIPSSFTREKSVISCLFFSSVR